MNDRLAVYIEPAGSLDEAVRSACLAEALGYHSVWVSQMADAEDAPTLLAAYGRATTRIGLGVALLTIYSRHPTAMIQMAATLDTLTAGRLSLGMGVGHELTVEWMWGLKSGKPIVAMREYTYIVRSVLETGMVDFTGQYFSTRWRYSGNRRADTPIFIGALGPNMLQLAGEIADGVLLWLCSPHYIRNEVIPQVRKGRERAGRGMEGFEVQAPIFTSLTASPQVARDEVKRVVNFYSKLPTYRRMLDASGFGEDLSAGTVSDDIVAELSGIGTSAEIQATVARYRAAGCTIPTLAPLKSHDGAADLEQLLTAAIAQR